MPADDTGGAEYTGTEYTDDEDTGDEVGELIDRWAAAELRADTTTLRSLISDDFAGIGPHGFQIDKAQWLHRYESGNLVNESFEITEVVVRRYGPVAVINGVQEQVATYQGRSFPGRFRLTLVAVLDGGSGRIVNVQLSPVSAR